MPALTYPVKVPPLALTVPVNVPLVAVISPVRSTFVAVISPLLSNEKLPAAISNALSVYLRYLLPSEFFILN